MSARIVLFGATGTAGSAALQRAIDHKDVSQVICVSRREPWIKSDKIKLILHDDFSKYDDTLMNQLKGCKGVIFALGLPSVGNSKEDWIKVHCTFARAAAQAFAKTDDKPNFVYISGKPVSWSAGQGLVGRMSFMMREGAKIEQDLLGVEGINAVICRSSTLIVTTDKPKEDRHWADKANVIFEPYFRRLFPSWVIRSDQLASVLVDIAVNGPKEGKGGKSEAGIYSASELVDEATRLGVTW